MPGKVNAALKAAGKAELSAEELEAVNVGGGAYNKSALSAAHPFDRFRSSAAKDNSTNPIIPKITTKFAPKKPVMSRERLTEILKAVGTAERNNGLWIAVSTELNARFDIAGQGAAAGKAGN